MTRIACRGSSTGGHPFRLVTVPFSVLMISVLAGCTGLEGSSARPGVPVAVGHEAHTRVDVLFARDIIEHSAQAVGLSSQITGMNAIAPEVIAIAYRIIASSTNRTNELQSLLLDWGFAPMTPGPCLRRRCPASRCNRVSIPYFPMSTCAAWRALPAAHRRRRCMST